MYVMDRYNRLICVVYVEYNSTHLLNVNKWLLDHGYVRVNDYPNEFNPSVWRLYVYYPEKVGSASTTTVLIRELITRTSTITKTSTKTFTYVRSTTTTKTVTTSMTTTLTKTLTLIKPYTITKVQIKRRGFEPQVWILILLGLLIVVIGILVITLRR